MRLPISLTTALLFALTWIACETPANPDTGAAADEAAFAVGQSAGGQQDAAVARPVGGQPGVWLSSGSGPAAGDPRTAAATQQGENEIKALASAYADRIDEVAKRGDDWALRIGDSWYFWAHGRLLPEDLRDQWEEFASYRFYSYSLDLPPIPTLDEEARLRLKERLERSVENPPRRNEAFLADLYGAGTRGLTEAAIVTVELVGFEVRVHRQIARPLEAVDMDLRVLIETDPGVQRFVAGLKSVAGYNWREIAGTRSRSYHSYGIAFDLAPKSFGGRHTYWRWALPQTDEFYSIPYENRWMVPLQIVKVFEDQGFIWGGKWFFFDTMHFEYRPEILVLAETAEDRR